MDLIPESISLAKAKTRQEDEDLYFQSEHSFLSNFYSCRKEENDHLVFSSAEQLFQYRKAIHANYNLTAIKIKRSPNPYEVKRLGNLVPTLETWRAQESDIMSDILLKKFTQNPQLGDQLLNTGNLNLHEASNDPKWATGAELSSRAILNGTWSGSDVMGQLLEGVRSELNRIYNINASPLSEIHSSRSTNAITTNDEIIPMQDDDEEPIAPPAPPPSKSAVATADQTIPKSVDGSLPPPPPSTSPAHSGSNTMSQSKHTHSTPRPTPSLIGQSSSVLSQTPANYAQAVTHSMSMYSQTLPPLVTH